MQSKKLPCDLCGRECNIRTKCKNKESEMFEKKLCLVCSAIHAAPKEKKNYFIPKQTAKNKEKRQTERDGLGAFFEYHIQQIDEKGITCQNCNARLYGTADNVAHILKKSTHIELSKVDLNILYLCSQREPHGNNCHGEFDNTFERREKMPVFKLALERYAKFKHLIMKSSKESEHLEKFLK